MKKLLLSGGIASLTIPSLVYYIAKYYKDKSLNFEESMFYAFVFICSLIIFGLIGNVYNAYQNSKLQKQYQEINKQNLEIKRQNKEIKEQNNILNNKIKELKDFIELCHYEDIEFHNNNREIILDLESKMDE